MANTKWPCDDKDVSPGNQEPKLTGKGPRSGLEIPSIGKYKSSSPYGGGGQPAKNDPPPAKNSKEKWPYGG